MSANNEVKIWEQIDLNRDTDVSKELDDYEEVIKKLHQGEIHTERFKSCRLLFGTYGVRHYSEGSHMIRIKVPSGFITSEQLRTIADVVERFAGSGHGHLTTRQDIQLHYVKLEDVPSMLRMLAGVQLTTREACGNTVRNITASYLFGICPDEIFDPLPYALYTTRYFLRHPLTSTLPRKFKIAFSECEHDHAMVKIHDLGCVSQIRQNGRDMYGFKVFVGGGLGAIPFYAKPIVDFVPVIVSCPGAFSCKLAVTHPYNLAEQIGERTNDLGGLRVNISGCPNSCGQHHVGDIGFYGASSKVGGKLAPQYVVLVGGNPFKQMGKYGQVIGKVPAKNAHLFVDAVVDFWNKNEEASIPGE